jgi:hypothetical protein
MSRLKRMGTSDMVSAPPTTTADAPPVTMDATPAATAALAEMHAMVTVCAGSESGSPAASTASRAMLDVRDSWITVPNTTEPSREGAIAVFVSSPFSARRARSTAMRSLYSVPDSAKGVRVPSTNTGRRSAGRLAVEKGRRGKLRAERESIRTVTRRNFKG